MSTSTAIVQNAHLISLAFPWCWQYRASLRTYMSLLTPQDLDTVGSKLYSPIWVHAGMIWSHGKV